MGSEYLYDTEVETLTSVYCIEKGVRGKNYYSVNVNFDVNFIIPNETGCRGLERAWTILSQFTRSMSRSRFVAKGTSLQRHVCIHCFAARLDSK
jgi:hypothetical protein